PHVVSPPRTFFVVSPQVQVLHSTWLGVYRLSYSLFGEGVGSAYVCAAAVLHMHLRQKCYLLSAPTVRSHCLRSPSAPTVFSRPLSAPTVRAHCPRPLSAPTVRAHCPRALQQVISRPCCFPSRSAGREPACTRGGEDRAIGGSQTDCSLALSVMPSAQSMVRCLWLVPLLVEASAFRTRSRTRAPAAATRLPARSARSSAPLAAASAAAEQGFPVVSLPPGFAAPTPRPLRASGDWGGLLLQLMAVALRLRAGGRL
ncbi:hypothetical protein T492DRAFT_456881, partial [Pavlovales sp. CCMP2436]